jgi:serine/threonine-protein kinase
MTGPRPLPSPLVSTAAGSAETSLPTDLREQAFDRLAILGLVTAVVWVLTRFIYRQGFDVEQGSEPVLRPILLLVGIGTSLLIAYLARYRRKSASRMLALGQGYLVLQAFLIGGATHLSPPEYLHPVTGSLSTQGVSWVAVWVLVYSFLVPNTPRRTLLTALVAVSMDPVWVYGAGHLSAEHPDVWHRIAGYRDQFVPANRYILSMYAINILMALLATLPSKIMWHLSRQVRRARLMGSYQLTRRLGAGGMGEVWEAEHRMLARPAAIKLVRPELLGVRSPDEVQTMLRRFEREAQATAALHSPHTIELYDFGVTAQSEFYYVMELLDGLDLNSLVNHFGPLPPARVVYLMRQACHSLYDAHEAGLTHRDIKPANLFVCRMGQDFDFVKVLDFGLVKPTQDHDATLLTRDDVASGTPAFMAPESALGKKDADHRVDLYALGCVAYWLLTGHLVFEGETPMALAVAHVQAEVVPPSLRGELEVPEDLERIVLWCLAKEPGQRPASARELEQALARCACGGDWDNEAAGRWWQMYRPKLLPESDSSRSAGSRTQILEKVSHESGRGV